MKSSHLVSLLVSILASRVSFAASSGDRPLPGYGTPVRIASSVLTFQQAVETRRPPKSEKILSNGEWDEVAVEADDPDSRITSGAGSGYLRFVGVVGTGLVYVPDDSADRVLNNGLLRISRP